MASTSSSWFFGALSRKKNPAPAHSVNLFDVSTTRSQDSPGSSIHLKKSSARPGLGYRNDGRGQFDGTFVRPSQNSGIWRVPIRLAFASSSLGSITISFTRNSRWGSSFLWNAGNHTLEAGFGFDRFDGFCNDTSRLDDIIKEFIAVGSPSVPQTSSSRSGESISVYLQDRTCCWGSVFVQPGVRIDVSPLLRQSTYVSPR